MKYAIFCSLALTLFLAIIQQTQSLQVDSMDIAKTRIDVKDPSWGTLSSGILKSHLGAQYKSNRIKTLIVSAPFGYGILATIRLLDLRPDRQDALTLFRVNDTSVLPYTYENIASHQVRKYYPREDFAVFNAPSGQLGVTFSTGPFFSTWGYGGFELTYTVQADWAMCRAGNFHCDNSKCISGILKCDGHNHCGDSSDQKNCNIVPHHGYGTTTAVITGTVFLMIAVACGSVCVVRRVKRYKTETRTIISHPEPSSDPPPYSLSYMQPGTCYPPPPPPYSPYDTGATNLGYH